MYFMRNLFLVFFILSLSLSGCDKKYEMNPVLLEIEKELIENPENVLSTLDSLYPGESFNDVDRSFYYILLTEARSRNDVSLLESDSLIDYSIKKLSSKSHSTLLARAYLSKGRVLDELEEPHKAVEIFYKGIDLLEKGVPDSIVLSKLYDELGNAFLYEFIYDKAMDAFRKELEIDRKLADIRGIAFSLRNIGSVFHFVEKPDSASYYYNEALKHAKQSKDSTYICDFIYNDISLLYKDNNEYEKALSEMNKIRNREEYMELNISKLLFLMGERDVAHAKFLEAQYSPNIYNRMSSKKYLSLINEKDQKFETALQYYKEYFSIIDSIRTESKYKEMKIIDHKHKSEIAVNQLKEKYQKVRMTIISIFIIILFILILLFSHFNKKQKLERSRKNLEIAELKERIAFTNYELIELKTNNEKNHMDSERKAREKEQLLDSLFQLEKNTFEKKKIYKKIQVVRIDETKRKIKGKEFLTTKEMTELSLEIHKSFPETIKYLKQDSLYDNPEQIMIHCLKRLNFSAKEIGLIFNQDASTIYRKKYNAVT